jgi:tetratricopeptide (TPR) repeat protein
MVCRLRHGGFLAPLLSIALSACAGLGPRRDTLHLSDALAGGDAEYRASMRLVLQGLEADANFEPDVALDSYQRALQVDPTNAWAYLALARSHVEGREPASAIPFLDKAHALLEAQGTLTPGAEAHLEGLRGGALLGSGRRAQALPHLERAWSLAPEVWADGRLDAEELR